MATPFHSWKTVCKKSDLRLMSGTTLTRSKDSRVAVSIANLLRMWIIRTWNGLASCWWKTLIPHCDNPLSWLVRIFWRSHSWDLFFIIVKCIVSAMHNLVHNVNSRLLVMSMRNFEEDIVKCMFIILNVLCFLNCGIPAFDSTPPMLVDHLFDIFITASNTQFCNYVQTL